MANKKISELDPAAALDGSELVPIVQDGETLRTTISAFGSVTATADINYYVSTTGSDSNDGLTALTPFATINHAIDVFLTLQPSLYIVTIHLAAGTYAEQLTFSNLVGRDQYPLVIVGDTGAPEDYILRPTASFGYAYAVVNFNGGPYVLFQGVTFDATNGSPIIYCTYSTFGQARFENCRFKMPDDSAHHANWWFGGIFDAFHLEYVATGVQTGFMQASGGCQFEPGGVFTLTGNPVFTATASYEGALILIDNSWALMNGMTFTLSGGSSATGKKFVIKRNGSMTADDDTGSNLFGSLPGTVDSSSSVNGKLQHIAIGADAVIDTGVNLVLSDSGANELIRAVGVDSHSVFEGIGIFENQEYVGNAASIGDLVFAPGDPVNEFTYNDATFPLNITQIFNSLYSGDLSVALWNSSLTAYSSYKHTNVSTPASSIYGLDFEPAINSDSTGDFGSIYGQYIGPVNYGDGDVTSMYGILAGPSHQGDGVVNNMYALRAVTIVFGASHHVNTMISVHSKSSVLSGATATNVYGVYIEDTSGLGGTISENFHSVGAASRNHFAGTINFGTATNTPQDGDLWFDGTDLKLRTGGATKTVTVT